MTQFDSILTDLAKNKTKLVNSTLFRILYYHNLYSVICLKALASLNDELWYTMCIMNRWRRHNESFFTGFYISDSVLHFKMLRESEPNRNTKNDKTKSLLGKLLNSFKRPEATGTGKFQQWLLILLFICIGTLRF